MAPQDDLEHYEATEAQDLTRLLRALRPPERAAQVPAPVDLTIRAEIWKVPVRRQLSTLLSMARRDLVQVVRQALADNPLLEEGVPAEDEHGSAGEERAQRLTPSADDPTDREELYDSIWQACVPDGWDANSLPSQASEAPSASEHPGRPPEAIVADVIVRKVGHDYQVYLNEEGMPRLRLSATYRRLLREGQGGEPEAKQYLDDKLRAAVWLIRSLEHRRQTLSTVAQSLVIRQRAFLDHGLAHLKPLALAEVADDVGMHASTVRRVIANKYLATAYGIIALTSFFPSNIESSAGELRSSLALTETQQRLAAEMRTRPQAAQAGATTPPPADAVKPVPRLQERIAFIHDLDYLIRLAIERVVALLEVEGVCIVLLDEARQELYFKVVDDTRAGHEPRLREIRFPATQGIAGEVIREGVPLVVPNPEQDPRWYRGVDEHTGVRTRSLACVPLRIRERIIGILEAINKRRGSFTAEDVRRLEAFADQLARALEQARVIQERYELDVQQLIAEAERLANRVVPFDPLIHESPTMQAVARRVEQVLNTTAAVLLTGERGTGKDHIARILHDQGPRAQGPFIAVNCAALPETGLEAELFGDERGAFTGATQRKPGRLELAAGGTLYLDEIAEMGAVLQSKLLRVLQEKTFTRVGGTEPLTTDARIVAATSQDLERLVAEGRFRRDLYYRLNIYPIALPPLRERQEDLSALAIHYLKHYSHVLRKDVRGLSEDAMQWLERYPWPGNVRELEEVIEQAVARCQGPTVTAQDLPQALREPSRAPVSSGEVITLPPGGIALADLEKQLIQQALEQADGNTSHAAQLLGLSRTELRTRLKQYGLETD